MLGGMKDRFRALYTEGPYGAFEQALDRALGEAMRADDAVCREVWSALANVDWSHPEHGEVGYSFRAGGDLIAAILQRGDYMDWYCCAGDAEVSERVADALQTEGWTATPITGSEGTRDEPA